MLPGVDTETGNACQQGWGSTRASNMSPSLSSPCSSCLSLLCSQSPACSFTPTKLGAGMHRYPMLLALLLFWGGERGGGGVERSPAQKRRRASPACLDPWSTGEGGMRLAGRQGWWFSMGWSKGGRVSCVHRSKGRHLEWAWPAGVSQTQRICHGS